MIKDYVYMKEFSSDADKWNIINNNRYIARRNIITAYPFNSKRTNMKLVSQITDR